MRMAVGRISAVFVVAIFFAICLSTPSEASQGGGDGRNVAGSVPDSGPTNAEIISYLNENNYEKLLNLVFLPWGKMAIRTNDWIDLKSDLSNCILLMIEQKSGNFVMVDWYPQKYPQDAADLLKRFIQRELAHRKQPSNKSENEFFDELKENALTGNKSENEFFDELKENALTGIGVFLRGCRRDLDLDLVHSSFTSIIGMLDLTSKVNRLRDYIPSRPNCFGLPQITEEDEQKYASYTLEIKFVEQDISINVKYLGQYGSEQELPIKADKRAKKFILYKFAEEMLIKQFNGERMLVVKEKCTDYVVDKDPNNLVKKRDVKIIQYLFSRGYLPGDA